MLRCGFRYREQQKTYYINASYFLSSENKSSYHISCSQHAENTFLCMRLNPRGLTPSTTGMDDRYEDEKGHTNARIINVTNFSVFTIIQRLKPLVLTNTYGKKNLFWL